MPLKEIRITETLKVAAGDTLADSAVVWDGGSTDAYAIECRGTLRNVLVSCRGRCSGVWHKATYADAASGVKVWEPLGIGYNASGCWGSTFERITIGRGRGTALLAIQANAAEFTHVAINGHSGVCIAIERANVLTMNGLAIEASTCDGVAISLSDVISVAMSGIYLEDNRGVEACVRMLSGTGNRMYGSCLDLANAMVVSRHEKHKVFLEVLGKWNGVSVRGLSSNALEKAVVKADRQDGLAPTVLLCNVSVPHFIEAVEIP